MNLPEAESQAITISPELAQRILAETGENVYLCYQCVRCTSGCPMSEFFDWQPNQVMRALQLGREEIALQSQTPWLCVSCQTCATRGPQGLNITVIMDFLTREALARGYKPPVSAVNIFNQAFMREVRLWGRSYELGLMAEVKLRTGNITGDLDLGVKMMRKGKLSMLPKSGRPPRRVKPIAGATDSIAYYPGCSLHSTAAEFNTSTHAVCRALGLNLVEPDGWVCCGSSAAHRSDPQAALQLPMENLAIIEQSGFSEVTMPCAACFNRHKAAVYELRLDKVHKKAVDERIGYSYQDRVQINTLSQTILHRVGPARLAEKVQKPLNELKIVCYYGCLLTRPPQVTEAAHPENPTDLDQLMAALGLQVFDWSYKTTCCGAALSLTRSDIVLELSSRIIQAATQAGAEAIVVACPLCHANLDARQTQMKLTNPVPILYFTQLMALALGLPEKAAALHKNLIDPRPFFQKKHIIAVS